jgi:hypothetical protein
MKTARKPRPKNLKHFLIASKNLSKKGLSKPVLTLLAVVSKNGDTTQIYIVKPNEVKRKTKKRIAKLINVSERIILFLGGLFGLIYTLKELFFK